MLGIEIECDLTLINSLLQLGDRVTDAVGQVIYRLVAEGSNP